MEIPHSRSRRSSSGRRNGVVRNNAAGYVLAFLLGAVTGGYLFTIIGG